MREILFRGKRVDDGKWIYGYYALHVTRMLAPLGDYIKDDDIKHKIIYAENTDWNMPRRLISTDVDHKTVGQYTGLKDKNGNKIFEGDIVTGFYHHLSVDYSKKGSVEMGYTQDSDGWACGITLGWISSNDSSIADLVDGGECEIIGNIHDNPELLN